MYAACNWCEHLKLSDDSVHHDDRIRNHAVIFDLSRTQFWVWFLIASNQVCSSSAVWSPGWKDEPVAEIWANIESFGRVNHGVFLRTLCLQKLGSMNDKVSALFFDDFTLVGIS